MATQMLNKKHNGPNQTITNRIVNVNWEQFLSSNLIIDKKSEEKEKLPNHFTGTFRRNRKKKNATNPITITPQEKPLPANLPPTAPKTQDKPTTDQKTNENGVKLTKFIAIDCEMVGVGPGGDDNMLARVSLVNKFGDCIYDAFVKPREEVVDYRTEISGIRREDMLNGEDFTVVQKKVSELIKGKILVGHALSHDLKVLFLSHPKRNIRDTSKYKPFKKITKGNTPSLKRLAKEILDFDIQTGEHSSVEDARAVMQLYCTVAPKWEASLSGKRNH